MVPIDLTAAAMLNRIENASKKSNESAAPVKSASYLTYQE